MSHTRISPPIGAGCLTRELRERDSTCSLHLPASRGEPGGLPRQSPPTQSLRGPVPSPSGEYLSELTIAPARDSIPLGAPFRLTASGRSNLGRVIPVVARRWTSLTPAIATVDSLGTLHPLREGLATIELTAGGWRSVHRSFVVIRHTPRVILHESWSDPLSERWIPFGDPLPRIVQDSILGPAFLNNGDGYFFSGAYLPRALDRRHGLALDATLRMPITLPREQYLQLHVHGIAGISALRRTWDHRSGYMPSRFRLQSTCGMTYPNREGETGALYMGPFGALTTTPGSTRPRLASGAPTRVRLQVLPDGRCGVAMDGERPVLSSTPLDPADSLYLVIQGNSVGTRLLVGAMTIRSGVPTDIDWSRARTIP